MVRRIAENGNINARFEECSVLDYVSLPTTTTTAVIFFSGNTPSMTVGTGMTLTLGTASIGDLITSGSPTINLNALSVATKYTPTDSAKWDGSPVNVQDAIDRIAAVVGDPTPIP